MKIVFLTQDDPIYILPFFDEFFRSYYSQFEIVGIYCSRTMGKRRRFQLFKELLSLYGLTGFLRLLKQFALAKLIERLPMNKRIRTFYSLRQICRTFNIPYFQITDPNRPEVVQEVICKSPDIIVSVACPYFLKDPILKVSSMGSINIHHALLPNYRGMMPTFWQMFHGESSVGLTIHYMTARVDAGIALLQESLKIQTHETLDHLIRRSKRHGAHCMARVLKEIKAGTVKTTVVDGSKGSYFTFPTVEEIRAFHRKGLKAI